MKTLSLTLTSLLALTLGASAQAAKETKIETTTTTTNAPASTTNVEAAASGVEIGIARRDGITFSSGEAFVTRNGIMEKLVKELELPGGVKVAPDGNVTMPDGQQFRLRTNQMVTMAGVVQVIPAAPTILTPVTPVVPNAAAQGASPAGNSAPARDTNQATLTGNTPTVPERVGAGSAAK